MSSELLYTSAPQGLKAGSRGFTTVLCTAGMPPNLADKLESFSGYKHVYSPQDPLADQNPVRYAYLRPSIGGRTVAVLSRLAAYGVDYSGRSNKIAHHIVLEPSERPSAGPAWLLNQSNLWKTTWDGTCKTLQAGPRIPNGNLPPGVCQRWLQVTGDAGWGGQVATWLRQSNKPIWLIYDTERQSQILDLITESLALLPPEERWKQTFATYFTGLPSDVDCRIRGVVCGSDEARLASARGHVIDLTKPGVLTASTELIASARTGRMTMTTNSALTMPELPSEKNSQNRDLEYHTISDLDENQDIHAEMHRAALNDSAFIAENTLSPNDGDYNLSPPPMPTDRKWKGIPILPSIDNDDQTNRTISIPFSIIILGGLALLTTFLLASFIFIPNLGFLRQVASSARETSSGVNTSTANNMNKKAEQQKDTAEDEVKSNNSETPATTSKNEVPEAEKESQITFKTDNSIERLSIEWDSKHPIAPQILYVSENTKETNYSIQYNTNSIRALTIKDNRFTITNNKLFITQPLDYEKLDETNLINTTITVTSATDKIATLPITIKVHNEIRDLAVEDIRLDITSKDTTKVINLRDYYQNKMDEVELKNFILESDGISVATIQGTYGDLTITGDTITYSLKNESLANLSFGDRKENPFTYRAYYSVMNQTEADSKMGKIEVTIKNDGDFTIKRHWNIASTVDGEILNLDKGKLKDIIKGGPYIFSFRNFANKKDLFPPKVLRFVENIPLLIPADEKNNTWEKVGRIAIFPLSRTEKSQITLDEGNELRKHLERVCLSNRFFVSAIEDTIEKIKKDLEKQLHSIPKDSNNNEDKEMISRLTKRLNEVNHLTTTIYALPSLKGDKQNKPLNDLLAGDTIDDLKDKSISDADKLIKKLVDITDTENFKNKLKNNLVSHLDESKLFLLNTEFAIEPQEVDNASAKSLSSNPSNTEVDDK
jgi:hypothetical protein